jgi:hypothetical protein
MSEAASEMSKWIPVVGTLGGAILGFLASFVTSWFNQRKAEISGYESRERQRLEEIYRTLFDITRDYQIILGQVIEKIHYEKPFETKPDTNIPPIIKLEMLVDLYFPELKDVHNDFVAAKNKFGEEYAQVISRSFKAETSETKQRLCGKFATLYKHIDDRLTAIQHRIQQVIKP